MQTLTAGQTAPDFTLQDQNGHNVSLADFRGKKVLMYFYPRASTPGCTVQACGLRDSKAELEKLGVVVLGLSPDTPKKLLNFASKQELNFTLLADEDHSVADAFGVWGPKKFMGRVSDGIHRTSFLIDEQGTIAHVFDTFKTKDHHQVVLDYLTQ
ncbi:thioredoxin-dependent thiol peroxidase [Alkalimonas sp.]|uniref:thioredoxin-dependent thiol peroxidase n=1 Tax=Alkalimonas sp. TaxID=1872453 RepID=UPI00263BC908|nr:thioredoxin-dependent thiol peroxidase [Alkalimonas sp.]MCC5826994.1 thioredoxin-dependent thiol peroxidase [Alkalimonas sp.]